MKNSKKRSVFHLYLKVLDKIEEEETYLARVRFSSRPNAQKIEWSEKRLEKLRLKEMDYYERFTEEDKRRYGEEFNVPYEEH